MAKCTLVMVPFIAFDPKRLPDVKDLKFHVGLIDGIVCDTGSASHEYLRNHPELQYSLLPRCMGKDFFPYDEAAFAKKGLGALANTPIDWSTSAVAPRAIEKKSRNCLAN